MLIFENKVIENNHVQNNLNTSEIKVTNDSIFSESNSFKFNVYPNPSNGKISLTNPNSELGNFYICDLIGEQTISNQLIAANQTIEIQLKSGVHFLTFTIGSNSITKKIIVL